MHWYKSIALISLIALDAVLVFLFCYVFQNVLIVYCMAANVVEDGIGFNQPTEDYDIIYLAGCEMNHDGIC